MALDLAQQSFNAGEWSPLLDGRSDLEKYYSACRVLDNMIPTRYGPAERRPGLYYVAELKDSDKKARLLPFKYSTVQAYILEAGDEYFRFFKDRGQILGGAGTEDLSALDNIVAHWLLNDNLATTAVLDDDGNTHDGAATANTEDLHATGQVGTGCFDFKGIYAVEIDDHADFSFIEGTNGDFSIIAWVYVTEVGISYPILAKWNEDLGDTEWAFVINADEKLRLLLFDTVDNKDIYATSDVALTRGWHKVGCTYEGEHGSWTGATAADYITLYVDGAAVASTATNDAAYTKMVAGASKVTIGAQYKAGPALTRYYPNKIDEVALFKDVLTATEMASLYSTSAYEISSPYLEADLFGIQRIQSADVMYGFHPDYNPRKLSRFEHAVWELESITFDWPPFMDENKTDTTITVTGAGAAPLAVDLAVTMTASEALFTDNHIGSFWLIKHPRTADETVAPNKVGSAEADGFFNAAGEVTAWLKDVEGSWNFRTAGTWTGEIAIERSYDEGTTVHSLGESLTSEGDQNFNVPGEETLGDAWLRARAIDPPGTLAWANETIPTLSVERYYHYGIVKVTAITSATVVTGEVVRVINSESATKLWSEGAWSDERGYPSCATFHEERLMVGGTTYQPHRFRGSMTDDWENFRTGTLDDHSVVYDTNAGEMNAVQWLISKEVLLVGTAGAEWKLGSFDADEPLTPGNPIKPRIQTTYGSKDIQAIMLANVVLFVQQEGRIVRGAQYVFEKGESGGYDSPDYTTLAEHITKSGIVGMAYQQKPEPILWAWLENGKGIGMTFEPGQKVWGWFPLVTDGEIESMAVIPGITEDEVWCIVKREKADGTIIRCIEYMKPRDWGDDQADCFFVDSGLTFDGGDAQDITNITKANPAVVTVATYPTDGDGDNLADGDQIRIRGVVGMTEVNTKVYTISNPDVSAKTFELRDKLDTADIDSTDFTLFKSSITGDIEHQSDVIKNVSTADIAAIAFGTTVTGTGIPSSTTIVTIGDDSFTISNKATSTNASVTITAKGNVHKVDNTFSGFGHQEGKVVSVLGDGSVHDDVVVTSGIITLTEYYNKVHAGLPFKSKLKPMKPEMPLQSGTARTKIKRISSIVFSFYNSLGCTFGTTEATKTIPYRKTTDPMGVAVPLFTGEKQQTFPGGYELSGDIFVEQAQPLPLTVRSIIPRLQLYDG